MGCIQGLAFFFRLQNWASEIETSIFGSWDSVGSKNEIGLLEVCVQGFGGLQTALVIAANSSTASRMMVPLKVQGRNGLVLLHGYQ
mmetsp:Transcript_16772/g.19320  ORF Transcript_16772/g.19320 Transcript_16772/m.19320 type:complete len:86 (+) Transcript_16772:754-1011(+)